MMKVKLLLLVVAIVAMVAVSKAQYDQIPKLEPYKNVVFNRADGETASKKGCGTYRCELECQMSIGNRGVCVRDECYCVSPKKVEEFKRVMMKKTG